MHWLVYGKISPMWYGMVNGSNQALLAYGIGNLRANAIGEPNSNDLYQSMDAKERGKKALELSANEDT